MNELTMWIVTGEDEDGDEIEREIRFPYTYYGGCRGARERGTGLQLEPDEDPEVTIEEAFFVEDDSPVPEDLFEKYLDDMTQKAWDAVHEARTEAEVDRWEARRDARMYGGFGR